MCGAGVIHGSKSLSEKLVSLIANPKECQPNSSPEGKTDQTFGYATVTVTLNRHLHVTLTSGRLDTQSGLAK